MYPFLILYISIVADMEEISARLALMSGISSEHFHDPGATGTTGVTPEKAAFAVRRGKSRLVDGNFKKSFPFWF